VSLNRPCPNFSAPHGTTDHLKVTAFASVASLEQAASAPASRSTVVLLLRLEGLVVATVSAVLYARMGASWWLFAALWLAPDLSMLGYLTGRPCWGARIYNAFHTYLLPGLLALAALVLHAGGVLPFAVIWINHIGVDRLMGHGLKYSDGFGFTHLGRMGRARA
jgi:hypothetical protein